VGEHHDGLAGAVYVYRKHLSIIVLGGPVRQEEVLSIIPQTSITWPPAQGSVALVNEVLQGLQVETGMKRVDPLLDRSFRIAPCTVVTLMVERISQACQTDVLQCGFPAYSMKPDEQ